MDLVIRRFRIGKDEDVWNGFIQNAKNSTFLFNRKFMDYHEDRFCDHSLIIYNEKGNIVACFPANEENENVICSHAGLTYGAFIIKKELKLTITLRVFSEILKYYYQNGFKIINYKAFPKIYNKIPSDEIDYCLFLSEAELWRRDAAIVLNQDEKIRSAGNIKREAKKAENAGYKIEESLYLSHFWDQLLIPNLQNRFGVNPVHNTKEIQLLANRFPEAIKLYVVKSLGGDIVCGTVFFLTDNVAHCQYIASTDTGRKSGALNLLFTELIDNILIQKKYFDFGIVNENNGLTINEGMLGWKERMGGRTVSHDFYKIKTKKNQKKINAVLSKLSNK